MSDAKTVTVYEPLNAPIKGLATYKSAMALPPGSGYYKMLQNVRWGDDGILTVRGETQALTSALAANKQVRGFVSTTLNGLSGWLMASFKDTSGSPRKTAVLGTYDPSAGFGGLTQTSGKYGDERLVADGSDSDYPTSFAVVHDRFDDSDLVVMQNGFDNPRVWNQANAVPHQAITPPDANSRWTAAFSFANFLTVSNAATFTAGPTGSPTSWMSTLLDVSAVSDSNWLGVYDNAVSYVVGQCVVYAESAYVCILNSVGNLPTDVVHWTIIANSASNNIIRHSVTTSGSGALAGSQKFTFASTDWSTSRQMALGVRSSTAVGLGHFLRNYKVTIFAGAVTYDVYDPSSTTTDQLIEVLVDSLTNTYVLGFVLDNAPAGFTANVTAIQFTAVSSEIATAPYFLDVYTISGTGKVPGGSQYAVSYYNSGSRAESYEQVLTTKTAQFEQSGGAPMQRLRVPSSDQLFFTVTLTFANTSATELGRGVDTLRIYRQDFGETAFTYCQGFAIASYGGSWTFTSGTAGSLRTCTDTTLDESRLAWLDSPGAFVQPIPIGRCMVAANNRLMVGGRSLTKDAFNRVCVSKAGFPFRFTSAGVDVSDPTSAVEQLLPSDNAQGFVACAASLIGSSSVYLFTDKSVWLINTSVVASQAFLTRAASVGTTSPRSICEHQGTIYFLDTEMRVRRMNGNQIVPISLGWVDDKLNGIAVTMRNAVTGAWFNHRYYLAIPQGNATSNTNCLIWSENAGSSSQSQQMYALYGVVSGGAWETLDAFDSPSTGDGICSWNPGVSSVTGGYGLVGDSRLLILGSNTICYRFEVSGGGITATPAVVILPGDISNSGWQGFTIRRCGVLADQQPAVTATFTRTYKPSEAVSTTSISLANPSGNYIWTWDVIQGVRGDAMYSGVAVSVQLSGNMFALRKFYAIQAEIEERDLKPSSQS